MPSRSSRASDILPRDLPPRMTEAFAIFLIALFVAGLGFVALVPLPEIVSAPFVLKSQGGADPVNVVHGGTVEAVRVETGSAVHRGDVLFTIRADDLRTLAAERDTLRRELASAERRLAALLGEGPEGPAGASPLRARVDSIEQQRLIDAGLDAELEHRHFVLLGSAREAVSALEDEVDARRRRVVVLEDLVQQARTSAAEGALAEREVLSRRDELEDAVAELAEVERAMSAALRELTRLRASRQVELKERELVARTRDGTLVEAEAAVAEKVRELEDFTGTARTRLTWMDAALAHARGDLFDVVAPYDGSVVSLAVERPGVAVERGQVLCELAREGVPLHAALEIPEREAAHVRVGERRQTVRLLFDGYPYTLHGYRVAELTWVSPAAVSGALPAIARLEDPTIVVDGRRRRLRPGMGGEARIYTGSRTLLDYVLEPMRRLRDNAAGEQLEG